MKQDIIPLTKQLITFPTYEGSVEAMRQCIAYVREYFKDTKNIVIEEFSSNDIPSLLISVDEKRRHFDILFNGHLDVVPAPEDMFTPVEKAGKIYGRGAADMKSMVAVMMATVKYAAQHGSSQSVGLMLVFDEEIGGFDGAKYQVEQQKVTADIVIIPDDMGSFELTLKEKGMVAVELSFKGKAAHSCEPWQGESAVDKFIAFGAEVRQLFPKPKQEAWVTTCNIGPVKSEHPRNQLADKLTASLDIRFIEDTTAKEILRKVRKLAQKHDAEVKVVFEDAAVFTPLDNKKVQAFKAVAEKVLDREVTTAVDHGASDGRHFAAHNIPILMFKSPSWGMHADDESVDVKGLEQFYDILIEYVR